VLLCLDDLVVVVFSDDVEWQQIRSMREGEEEEASGLPREVPTSTSAPDLANSSKACRRRCSDLG
jgi:hypothetical protein